MVGKVLCTWVDHFHKVVYLTLKRASDGYADGADGITGLMTAEKPEAGTCCGMNIMYA